MKTASKNTDVKQTLARGSAKMLRKLAITAARLKRAGGGVTTPRKANNAAIVTINPNEPRIANTPRQPSRSQIPPATSPAATRMATSSEKLVATAQTSADNAITSRHRFISRVLPKKSPVTPSAGCTNAYGNV